VNKLVLAIAGAAAAGAAAAALGAGASSADPSSTSTYNVVGEPYAKAVAILRAQGVKTSFGGSVGSDVPQAQCLVKSEKIVGNSKISLMLDCTAAAQPDVPAAPTQAATSASGTSGAAGTQAPDAGGRPTPGAPGVVTVIPTRVG
jgi:hypothetical protein